MQATQLPEPAAVPVQRPASPALAPALRTISGETPHYRARFEVAAADGADAAEAVKEIVMGWLHAKGLDVPEGAADIAVPAGWTAADEPDAARPSAFSAYPARKARHGRSRPMSSTASSRAAAGTPGSASHPL